MSHATSPPRIARKLCGASLPGMGRASVRFSHQQDRVGEWHGTPAHRGPKMAYTDEELTGHHPGGYRVPRPFLGKGGRPCGDKRFPRSNCGCFGACGSLPSWLPAGRRVSWAHGSTTPRSRRSARIRWGVSMPRAPSRWRIDP